ncbi:MAG TPA: PAS domain-containing sensor histidine kinase [Oscillatoriaceae cyanobacterium]
MSLLGLAAIYNIFGIALVLALSLYALRTVQAPFFRAWVRSYAAGFTMIALDPSLNHLPPSIGLIVLQSVAACAAIFSLFQTAFLLLERALPVRAAIGLMGALALLVLGLYVRFGMPWAMLPFMLMLSAGFFAAGGAMIVAGRRPAEEGLGWIGGTTVLRGLELFDYGPLASHGMLWIGYAFDGALQISVGSAMVAFMLRRTARELEGRNADLQARDHALSGARDALEREKIQKEALLDHLPGVALLLDRDLTTRWVNLACVRLWGKPAEQILGQKLQRMLALPDARLSEMLERGEAMRIPRFFFSQTGPDGDRQLWLDLTLVPIGPGNGTPEGLLLLGIDVSAQAENERSQREHLRRLEEFDRHKSEFVTATSQALRAPLAALVAQAEHFDDPDGISPQAIAEIKAQARHVQQQVETMLDYAMLESGLVQLSPRAVPVRPLIESTLAHLTPEAQEKGLMLGAELEEGPLLAYADERRVGQVLQHLLTNAIVATPAGGRVRVRVSQNANRVAVEIEDTGSGIPPEAQARIFEKFATADGGTGLGLALAKALVEANGGAIGVESEPGRGSTFWFTLPAVNAKQAS